MLPGTHLNRPASPSCGGRSSSISDSVLSERLAELTKGASSSPGRFEPGPPVKRRYSLTEAGEGLLPALEALTAWAAVNLPAGDC